MVFKLAVVTCGIAMGVALTFNAALAADPSAAPTEATPAVHASAASELSDRKLRTMKRNKSAKTLSQSGQDLIIDRCLRFLVSALQIDRNLARFTSRQ